MTKQDIVYKIETDPNYAIAFAVDNNPEGIQKGLLYFGYDGGYDREYLISVLTAIAKSGDAATVKEILNTTPYIDKASNYTGGMLDYFAPTPTQNSNYATAGRFDLTAFLGALGSGLTTYSSISGTPAIGSNMNQQPVQTGTWFSRNWIWLLLIFVVIVFIIVIVKKLKGKKNATKN